MLVDGMNALSDEESNSERRVKLYFLNDDGQWDDRGTGHVQIVQDDSEYLMVMKSEEEKEDDGNLKALLNTKVSQDDIYQQQQGICSPPRIRCASALWKR